MKYDWSNCDFVLANSTCFDMDLMQKIADKASLMKKGSWVLTLTKRLPSADIKDESRREWDCVYSIKKQMSWGVATVNLHHKVK